MDLTKLAVDALLSLDPKTGVLTWKERPLADFATLRACAAWNAKHAGRSALISKHKGGYRYGKVAGQKYLAHRIVWLLHYGVWPSGQIDHIDGNPENNAICNLRDVDNATNGKNQKINRRNTSGTMGVVWDKALSKWQARIGKKHIGVFTDIVDAVAARKSAELQGNYHPNHGARS